nr:hypothetical protein [Gemmatimonadota bacterium]NIT87292.1 hypothetical protein [Gemmatimonadota bacterium]NIU31136.1 hypothetical protein [Gemmatimonadota bacterium]NIU35862.1 hypothetical protein [Gemmatimonadota bacterium]NIV61496.1 hypothetical protein [Gemmatimonadota bacterium]
MGRRPAIGGGRRILEDPARARFCFISPGLCIALIVAPQELGAQGGEAQREVTYSVPKAPAFHLIGASPSDVGRPGSPRELAVSLLSAVDSAGRLQQGFALEFSPGLALSGSVDANEYRTDFWKRLVARTGLSLGTAKASGGGSGTRMAVGGRAVLVDRTDPMV